MLVAEDITSRFLNVISLFNKAIPLIAIQLRALDVGGVLTINATTVLDLARPGTEEEDDAGQATDRGYWVSAAPKHRWQSLMGCSGWSTRSPPAWS